MSPPPSILSLTPFATVRAVGALAVACWMLTLPGCRSTIGAGGPLIRGGVAQAHLADAKVLQSHGYEEQALAALQLALEDDPQLTDAHLMQAQIHRGRGDTPAALAAYQRAGELDPSSFDAAYGSGLMLHLAGRLREAVESYRRALGLDSNSHDASRDLGAAWLQLGRPDEALGPTLRATELDPQAQPAWGNLAVTQGMLGDWEGAVNSYRRAAELGGLDDPMLLGLANAHIQLGNFERAANVLASAQRRKPTQRAHERLGHSFFRMGRYDEALREYRQALRLDPTDVPSLNGTAVVHLTLDHLRPGPNPYHRVLGVAALRESLLQRSAQPRIVDLLSRYDR